MKTIVTLVAISFAFMLAGCNTVQGVGQDVQKAGEKIEDSAKKKYPLCYIDLLPGCRYYSYRCIP